MRAEAFFAATAFLGPPESLGSPREDPETTPFSPDVSKTGGPKNRSKKRSKTKQNCAPDGAMRGVCGRGGRVKTLRVLQGSVRTLQQLWISAGILQDSVQDFAFRSARRQGAADLNAPRIPPDPIRGLEIWRSRGWEGQRQERVRGSFGDYLGIIL